MQDGNQRFSEEKAARGSYDLIVTFDEDARAHEALMALRREGFTPEQAILLQPESAASSDPFSVEGKLRFSPDQLSADRTIAVAIIIATEVAVGAIAGAVLGWIISLFLYAPQPGPAWAWMLILGAAGALAGAGLGALEWKRWARELEKLRQQTAIGLRFTTGRHPATALQRARAILEHYGGSGMDNA